VQLALAGVPQRGITAVVGCDRNRVSRVVKHVPKGAMARQARET
jgi:hypothetical protein